MYAKVVFFTKSFSFVSEDAFYSDIFLLLHNKVNLSTRKSCAEQESHILYNKSCVLCTRQSCIRIRIRRGSNIPLWLKKFPRELRKLKGYIWLYIPSWVLIRTVYNFNNHDANYSLIKLIQKYSIYFLGSVLWNIPLAWK